VVVPIADTQANPVEFVAVGAFVAITITPATIESRDTFMAFADETVVAVICLLAGRSLCFGAGLPPIGRITTTGSKAVRACVPGQVGSFRS